MPRRLRTTAAPLVAALAAVALLAVGCASTPPVALHPGPTASAPTIHVEGCDPTTIGEDEGRILSAVAVEGTAVVGVCTGAADPTVLSVAQKVAELVPPGGIGDVIIVAGYDGGAQADTLALAGTLTDRADGRYVVEVNVPAVEASPDELLPTLVHELSHVLTETPDQYDMTVARRDCTTVWDGTGCAVAGSFVDQWTRQFWTQQELDALPRDGQSSDAAGGRRCRADPGFVDAYAATAPVEDFAESFAAYVLDVPVPAAVQSRMSFFDARPSLRAYRDRARAAGIRAPDYRFAPCG